MATLCLNMIVRNESARIIRALESARPHIAAFAILDTGSTDGTVELIQKWGEANNVPGIIAHGAFVNFSQARNQALDLALSWRQKNHVDVPYFDMLLLMDADMELVVENPRAFEYKAGEMYHMVQKAGAVSYNNPRLLSVFSKARYVGATHEYLAAPTTGLIEEAHFVDHADGANRADKYERDIKLLRDDLRDDPNNPRSWFYLGNSYRDGNRPDEALACYQKRLELGGWDEENFVTACYVAHCYKDLGDENQFLAWCLKAYEMRPTRAESLYDAAHYLRENGQIVRAMMFIKEGIAIPRPDDQLFVNDFVYSHGFREEYSIAGFYTDNRETAFKMTNGLALDKTAPEWTRSLARTNMVHYLQPLVEFCPSARHTPIHCEPEDGFIAMNPSVALSPGGAVECIVRTVNYKIDSEGRYMLGEKGPIVTKNRLLQLDSTSMTTLYDVPIDWVSPLPKWDMVIGLEDMRLFWHKGVRRFSACVREQSEQGICEQWQGTLHWGADFKAIALDSKRISDGTTYEKNWAPLSRGETLDYVYRLGQLQLGMAGRIDIGCPYAAENISGSSQWVRFNGGYLAIVHEAIVHPGTGKRVYQHRFAFYDHGLVNLRLSPPFVFHAVQIEFCAGLAWHPNSRELIASYGVRDCEAWVTRFTAVDVVEFLGL